MTSTEEPTPTSVATRWVKVVISLTVSVGVGLAPLLGATEIELFAPLLGIIPEYQRTVLLTLSTFLVSIVAVFVQFYAREKIPRERLRRWFLRLGGGLLVSTIVFYVLHALFTVEVPLHGGEDSVTLLIAWSRAAECPCATTTTDILCIKEMSIAKEMIDQCWGRRAVIVAGLVIGLPYLALMAGIGALIGLLVVRDELVPQAKPKETTGVGADRHAGGPRSR